MRVVNWRDDQRRKLPPGLQLVPGRPAVVLVEGETLSVPDAALRYGVSRAALYALPMHKQPEFKDQRLTREATRNIIEEIDGWRTVSYSDRDGAAADLLEQLLEEMKGWRNALAAHYMASFYDGAPDAGDSPIPQR